METFNWKSGSRIKVDPNACGTILSEIASRNDGQCLPGEVVKEAKKARSPLHGHFEWSDQEAARLHRLGQAQHLIRCLTIEDERADDGWRPVFCSIQYSSKEEHQYIEASIVASDPELRDMFLESIRRKCDEYRRYYKQQKALMEAIEAVENLISTIV